jgi:predicted RNA-binding Zn-ribbon protein involved in translation (DUF1610 family)
MSYYGIHNAHTDSMICADCQTEAFAWMADIFACPVCGSNEYIFASQSDAGNDTENDEKRTEDAEGTLEKQGRTERKRKREGSSEREGW